MLLFVRAKDLGEESMWTLPVENTAYVIMVVLYADDSVAHTTLSSDDKWRIDVHLDEVDPRYVEALIQLEDERYRFHPGVDPIAVGDIRDASTELDAALWLRSEILGYTK